MTARTKIAFSACLLLMSCERATVSAENGYGPSPILPAPKVELIPTVNIAPAVGWKPGETPVAAKGLKVNAFAEGLDHPRWLYTLPNGDVLVAESNAPAKADAPSSLKGLVMKDVMKRAGAATASADRISLLRDADHDGVAETRTIFLANLHSPFGMALIGNTFYVANTDAVVAFSYTPNATRIIDSGEIIAALPVGPINHHWTKDLIASPDGSTLYATVGSNSNVGENGMEAERNRAAVLKIDLASRRTTVFASGLRNPNGLSWQPETGALWVAVNERDELGSDLVPDYMTSLKQGGFYGWPYSYYGQHVDARVKEPRPDLVAKAIEPDYALGTHTAPLGLAFSKGSALPAPYRHGVFIGQHGSWNREPPAGYRVIFVPFRHGKPAGQPQEVLTGFLNQDGNAMGRPVGVTFDKAGALLVADDVGNKIWRVVAAP